MLQTKTIEYTHNQVTLEGYCVYDDALRDKRPTVLIAHDWSGRGEFSMKKAEWLASMGYVGFALDMYGRAKTGSNKEENMAMMKPLMDDRSVLQQRMLSALAALHQIEQVDVLKVAVMGFCFGGLCALDLARTGADILGAVSVHGLLGAPDNLQDKKIKAKILALHGFDDPMVTPKDVLAFENEMTAQQLDWQCHVYGKTMHAFTNPNANDSAFGTVYNPIVERRALTTIEDFFREIFK